MTDLTPVDAIQYNGTNAAEVATWTGTDPAVPGPAGLPFSSAGTDYVVRATDWIVRAAPDEYVVCTNRLFASSYTAV
jgi:hypothetical protein